MKPNDRVKNIKFQLNYLEYPYLANVAINKNNELIVILVRRQTADSDKPYNAVLNRYYDESERYFKKKGNKVVVINNENEIRNTLKELIKWLFGFNLLHKEITIKLPLWYMTVLYFIL